MRRILILMAIIISASRIFAQPVTERPIVYQIPAMKQVQVKEKIQYRKVNDTALTLDIYYPEKFNKSASLPVVIFNNGVGSMDLPQWRVYKDWAKLIAANGMIAVSHQTRPGRTTLEDGGAVLDYLHQNAKQLNIDADRMAIWTCSGNARIGMRLALKPGREYIRTLVVYYGPPDSLGELRQDVPTLMVRAGLDAQVLNMGIENFVQSALMQDARIEMINYVEGIHAFDIYNNTDESRSIIKQTVDFLRKNLTNPVPIAKEKVLTNRNFMWMIHNGQSKEAFAAFRKAVTMYRADTTFHPFYNAVIREDVLNTNAYYLLNNGRQNDALEAFKLMVETYPASANAYDGLGDAYERLGNKAEAIVSSQKAIELLEKDTRTNAQTKARIRESAEAKINRLK